jgi:hypothetical protein
MAAEALYGFVGVLLGSGSTAMLTVYRERLVSRREREALQHQREQDRKNQRDTFQRQSLLALQDAISDLIKAVYTEQDRILAVRRQTGQWPPRQWDTPTAAGWEDANLRLQAFRARVFNGTLRDVAGEIQTMARECIYAASLDEAKQLNAQLRQIHDRFNELTANTLPELY